MVSWPRRKLESKSNKPSVPNNANDVKSRDVKFRSAKSDAKLNPKKQDEMPSDAKQLEPTLDLGFPTNSFPNECDHD